MSIGTNEEKRLRSKVHKLEKRVDELEEKVGENQVGAIFETLLDKITELENRNERYEEVIGELADEWGHNGEISTKTQKNERGNIVSRSIHDYVGDAMDREYSESIQHGQVYDAMRELGTAEAFTFERTDSARYLIRSE